MGYFRAVLNPPGSFADRSGRTWVKLASRRTRVAPRRLQGCELQWAGAGAILLERGMFIDSRLGLFLLVPLLCTPQISARQYHSSCCAPFPKFSLCGTTSSLNTAPCVSGTSPWNCGCPKAPTGTVPWTAAFTAATSSADSCSFRLTTNKKLARQSTNRAQQRQIASGR